MAQILDWTALAKALPLLGALPVRLRGSVSQRHVDKEDFIFRRGDRPRTMFAVLSGEARLIRTSPAGGDVVLQRARRGLLAEASLDQPRYHCDAVAALPTDLVCIPRNSFKDALADDDFRNRWVAQLLHELRRIRAQSERLALHSAKERIIHFIEAEGENGHVELTQSKKDWAAELGLTHEALYRTLAQMENGGVLRIDGRLICLRLSNQK